VVASGRTRGHRHKPKYRRFPLNIRKHFTVRVRLPREVLESPSSEIFKSCLDMVLSVALLEQGGCTRGPFQPQPFCDSVTNNLVLCLQHNILF